MRIRTQILIFFSVLALTGLLQGCALLDQSQRNPKPAALADARPTPECPDRVDRAKVGGLAGTVLGTVAGSVIGIPVIGGLYQLAGYVIGFASGAPCPEADQSEKTEESESKTSDPSPQAIREETI